MTNEQADQTIPTPQMLWSLADQSYPFGSPWNVQQFQQDLQNSNSRYLFRYGKTNQELIGFLCFQQVLDEAGLFNVAVLPAYQGRGLAKELLKQMESLVEQTDGRRIYLEVRVSNLQAQALYLRMGYTVIGRRKKYYSHPEEDALIMEKKVGGQKSNE